VPNLKQDQLHRLARLGAVARLEQLRTEEAAIRAEFPELFGGGRGGARRGRRPGGRAAPTGLSTVVAPRRSGRRPMSTAARKAVSERMRKYWAERRKAKAAK
jgi:hypothetical protein